MPDIFDKLPAPTQDELRAFEDLAREAPPVPNSDVGATLHNQFRLAVPRLVQEIRHLRELAALFCESERLTEEKKARQARANQRSVYDGELEALILSFESERKPKDVQ